MKGDQIIEQPLVIHILRLTNSCTLPHLNIKHDHEGRDLALLGKTTFASVTISLSKVPHSDLDTPRIEEVPLPKLSSGPQKVVVDVLPLILQEKAQHPPRRLIFRNCKKVDCF